MGFQMDSTSFISFNITIDNVEIKAIIYEYYSSSYCSIKSINQDVKLPSNVLAYFNEWDGQIWRDNHDVSIDFILGKRSNGVQKNCDKFATIMAELYKMENNLK